MRQVNKHKLLLAQIFWVGSRSIILSSLLVTGLWQGLQQWGSFEFLELSVFDAFVRLQRDRPADPRLLIVTITEQDLHHYGWPLSDRTLARSLEILQRDRPRVIGLDLYRDIANPPGQQALAAQLQADNLIAIKEVVGNIPPPPAVEAERVGFNDLILDADGVLRRNLLFVAAPEQDYYSFALRLSIAYLDAEGIAFRQAQNALFLGNTPLLPLNPTAGGYQQADTNGYQILVNYRNRGAIAPTVTLSQVLNEDFDPALVRDKIVAIGTIAPSLKDRVLTPYSAAQTDDFQMSGVIVHAQMTSQLLDIATGQRPPFRFWRRRTEILWLWAWTLIGSFWAWRLQHPLSLSLVSVLCLVAIAGIGWGLFSQLIWIPLASPALGYISALGIALSHRLLYATTRDALTGLLNRNSFLDRLNRHLSRPAPAPIGVLFLNLERLEMIHNSLGSKARDRILLAAIARLKALLPRSAFLARVSESEIALALPHNHPDTLTQLAERLQAVLSEPFPLYPEAIVTPVRLGIAIAQPKRHHTASDLLRDAHTAMYRAKALGKNRYQVFAAGMLKEVVDRFTLENELRRSIVAQDFVLYYQPIINLKTAQISGFEALIRWQHPQLGFVSPAAFIPIAEETGLILSLGQWICRTACHQLAAWQQQLPQYPLVLSINLSSRQFEQPDLTEQLAQILQETGIEGRNLKLEITESMVMGDVEAAIDLMLRLKSLGCKLSLDDFGTGYSSLSQLRRFPVDTLKVDKSFVENMSKSDEDRQIVRTIIDLGHLLGMDVIAEGVESESDADVLRSLNCEYGQGYFWSKPLPVAAATALLQKD
jgi:diguanylate cyclase (GGDEF)-like protein